MENSTPPLQEERISFYPKKPKHPIDGLRIFLQHEFSTVIDVVTGQQVLVVSKKD